MLTRKHGHKNIIEKHGKNILNDFELLRKNPAWTLERLGKKYGVTREWVRQLYKKHYGRSYTDDHKKKMRLYNEEIGLCLTDPKRKVIDYAQHKQNSHLLVAQKELLLKNICKKKGFSIEYPEKGFIGLIINGHTVAVKISTGCYHTSNHAEIKYYQYRIKDLHKKYCDFIACYHETEKSFFLVPINKAGKFQIYISKQKSNYRSAKNRYWEFKDAWHLLQ